jgi:hypothetical protein
MIKDETKPELIAAAGDRARHPLQIREEASGLRSHPGRPAETRLKGSATSAGGGLRSSAARNFL